MKDSEYQFLPAPKGVVTLDTFWGEIIFSIVDMVHRSLSSFVAVQDDDNAQEVADILDAL